jgi:apolipoprotein N-acyltransferase
MADMDRRPPSLLAQVLACVLSAVALFFGTGLHPLWWLLWLAPVPLLVIAPRLTRLRAFALAFLACLVGGLNEWHFFRAQLGIPAGVVLTFVALPAVIFGLDVLAFRRFAATSPWRAALVFPSIWVLSEFITARISIHGTAGNVAYSQMNFLPILQIASVTGIWGISFCIFLFAATAAVLIGGYGELRQRQLLGRCVGVALLVVLAFGFWRLYSTPPAQTVAVGLVASDVPKYLITESPSDTRELLRLYADQAEALALSGAKTVVIPEKVSVIRDSDLPDIDPLFQTAADKTGAVVVVGVIHVTDAARWNEARIYSPGGPVRMYEKHHMLPPFESNLKPGTTRTIWQEPSGTWGAAICKDLDFPKMGRDYGNDGTGLLLVPAWDFGADGWLHGRMAVLRGVESGFSIARAPKQGVLTLTDDRGRVIAEQTTGSTPFAAIAASVPVRNSRTVYARFGDWLAWANVALFLWLIGSGLMARRKTADRTRTQSTAAHMNG